MTEAESRPPEVAPERALRPALAARGAWRQLDGKIRWLIVGQLAVFGLSLQDEELMEFAAEALGLGHRAAVAGEVVLSLLLFCAWGALTVAWVRLVSGNRR